MCFYTYLYKFVHQYLYTHIYIYTHTCRVHKDFLHTDFLCTPPNFIFKHVFIHICTNLYINACLCIHKCMFMHIYIYIHICRVYTDFLCSPPNSCSDTHSLSPSLFLFFPSSCLPPSLPAALPPFLPPSLPPFLCMYFSHAVDARMQYR